MDFKLLYLPYVLIYVKVRLLLIFNIFIMKRKITIVLLTLLISFSLSAQTADRVWSVGLHGGKNVYSGDLGNALFNFDQAFYGFGGLSLSRYISKSFDVSLFATYGSFGFFKNETRNFLGYKFDPAIIFSYKLSNGIFLREDSRLVPTLNFGVGAAMYFGDRIVTDGFDPLIPVGLGLKYNVNDNLAIQAYTFSNIIESDRRDGYASTFSQGNDHYFRHSLGLIYNFGVSRDATEFSQTLEEEPTIVPDKKWSFGIHGGKTEYSGDYGNALFRLGRAFYGFGGLSLGRYIDKNFDVNLKATFGSYGYLKNPNERFLGNKLDAKIFLSYKLTNGYILKENAKLVPTLNFGAGTAFYMGDNIVTEGNDWIIPIGVGLRYNINENMAVQAYSFANSVKSDHRDGFASTFTDYNDHFFKHSIGLIYTFGKPSDTDKDGVPDKSDKCSDTPSGVAVDEFGCPLDTDKDGIADYIDKCPNTPNMAKVNNEGCPIDTDNDGVADYLDKCPNTPNIAKVNNEGCPIDTDNDGIADYIDKCANTPRGTKVDKDGCPIIEKPKVVEETPVVVPIEKPVAPQVVKPEVVTVKFEFNNVMFDKNSFTIRADNLTNLNNLVKLLNENKNINVILSGHACAIGSEEVNNRLSRQRAEEVRRFLTTRGINANRITIESFGSEKPAATNDTEEGKVLNRRVEIREKK